MASITVKANVDMLDTVQSFIAREIKTLECHDKDFMSIEVCVEEIFVNIASYAYYPGKGEAIIDCDVDKKTSEVTIVFKDGGTPFNPLEKKDADISPDALLGREGGLGILMVKKMMDFVSYEYKDGKNILLIRKKIC